MEIEIQRTENVEVKYLAVSAGARYWEDATVNGTVDDDGTLIPFRVGDTWAPVIDLDTGKIEGWPDGTIASIHYKVCDDGVYSLCDANRSAVLTKEGYVPDILCPKSAGYGDYIIMDIGPDGTINDFDADLAQELAA